MIIKKYIFLLSMQSLKSAALQAKIAGLKGPLYLKSNVCVLAHFYEFPFTYKLDKLPCQEKSGGVARQ